MIDLAVVKAHLRVEHADEDAKIQGYIDAALSTFETWTNRKLETVMPDPVGNSILMSKSIEQGALLIIGHWYANVEGVVVGTITAELPLSTRALWQPHRWVNV